MVNSTDKERVFHYLEINRGRYLCDEHGAFCDSSDGYTKRYPICSEVSKTTQCTINKVDRLLQVVNGLQNRSKRNVALLASLIGGIGVLRLVSEFGGNASSFLVSTHSKVCAYSSVIILLVSLAMYGASMVHIRTTSGAEMMSKSLSGWEAYLASKLSKMECWHSWAGKLFGVGAFLLATAIFFQMVSATGSADYIQNLIKSWLVCRYN